MQNTFLCIAAVITVAAVVPYALDIIKGTTKPNIVSWLTWTILTAVATIAEFASGEFITAMYTSSAVLATGIIVVLGLRYGYAKYSKFDFICQIGALSGFILWWIFDSAALAVAIAVTIDFIGSLPTVRHSWIHPSEETWITFAMAGVGGIFAFFALSTYSVVSLSYPVYIILINIVITFVILYRKRNA